MFLLIGQSNMAGRGALLDEDRVPLAGVKLNDHCGQWIDATQPFNRYSSNRRPLAVQGYCMGGSFAQALVASGASWSVGLIVNAMGGSPIEWWQPPLQPLYQSTLVRWIDAGRPRLAGVLWHQGENNQHDTNYASKAIELFTELRKSLNQPDLPLMLGHISPGEVINPQIDAAARKLGRAAVVGIDGLSLFDDVHYDRESSVELGRRYAEAYLRLAACG